MSYRLIIALIVATICVLLCGCVTPADNAPTHDNVRAQIVAGKVATARERTRCDALGGKIERAGMLGYERCTRPYADAGKSCMDSAQCEGQCRTMDDFSIQADGKTTTGQCQVNDNPFGCYGEIKRGRVETMLCVD